MHFLTFLHLWVPGPSALKGPSGLGAKVSNGCRGHWNFYNMIGDAKMRFKPKMCIFNTYSDISTPWGPRAQKDLSPCLCGAMTHTVAL